MTRSVFPLGLLMAVSGSAVAFAASCESLSNLTLPHTRMTMAKTVSPGAFPTPEGFTGQPPVRDLPAYCRVAAIISPSNDSEISIEAWLPLDGWNGKLEAVGNGGFAGWINHQAMAAALKAGYATASTDTGHKGAGDDASFALGHPEKVIDFGYRAVHEMTIAAKAIVAAYYGSGPKRSYWSGCSSGGKQGLKEAQKYPLDYDGILAGAPANYWTHLMVGDLWNSTATLKDPASYIPKTKYPTLHQAALDACDALDGLKDGLIGDPRRCHFDLAALLCKGPDGPDCLTAPQIEAAKKIYGGSFNPRTGKEIYPGLSKGSELGWGGVAGGPKPFSIPDSHFKYLVFKNPNWDFRTFDFDRGTALTDRLDHGTFNAVDPDLRKFTAHGGKLILYHGWNDTSISPLNTLNYFNQVTAKLGGPEATRKSVGLFLAPGMRHCGGGEGPGAFDAMPQLDRWVEQGIAPETIIATQTTDEKVGRTRPLCSYPQVARYKGSGTPDDAANFTCVGPDVPEQRN